jgi:glucose/arabinose dehydrogenase
MRRLSRLGLACSIALLPAFSACGSSSPPPSTSEPPPGGGERISGNERLGWNQSAESASELATLRYAAYIDTNNRVELTDVSCGASGGGFACNSRMPSMSSGSHSIELVSFVLDGDTVVESGRAAPLRVTVTGVTAEGPPPVPAAPSSTTHVSTADGLELRVDVLAATFDSPTAIAPAPDGRVFVAEREGRVRILRNGALEREPAIVIYDVLMTAAGDGGLLALAVDPQFERTHFVYAAYTVSASQGTRQFRVARYREVNGSLGERVVVLDAVPAAARPAVQLGVGPDDKLYVAFDAAGNGGRTPAQASYSGKLLRLNADGTTPQDQPSGLPFVASELQSPRGMDWQPSTNTLWLADAKRPGLEELRIINGTPQSRAGRARINLPAATGAASMAFYRGTLLAGLSGDLLVAAAEGHHLLRLRLDERDPTRVISSERLLQDVGSPVRAVATSSDGTIYAATDRELLRIGPR